MKSSTSSTLGSTFVGFAAILWATDALVRYPLVQKGFDPTQIVFFDHLIALLLLSPYILFRFGKQTLKISPSQWTGLFILGGGASALATVLFTASFKYVNPSVSILLQKLQPILVVLLAMLFLGERPTKSFYIWAPVALLAGLLISFPDFNFHFVGEIGLESKGSLYAIASATLWGLSTVVGKGVVSKLPPLLVTFWRFAFGLVTLGGMILLSGTSITLPITDPEVLRSVAYLSVVPGLSALILYYQGMRRTQASTTTFMELLFPVSAVAINTIFLKTPLLPVQAAAALVLLFAVTQISLASRK